MRSEPTKKWRCLIRQAFVNLPKLRATIFGTVRGCRSDVFRVDNQRERLVDDVLKLLHRLRQLSIEMVIEIHQIQEAVVPNQRRPLRFQHALDLVQAGSESFGIIRSFSAYMARQ